MELNDISTQKFKDEFKITYNEQEDEVDEFVDILDKEIEQTCDYKGYIDELVYEERSDEELIKLDKREIIEFKNYQISKLKAYINSLEKEKEDLIETYKINTNQLVDRIRELQFESEGYRPQTAQIVQDIKRGQSNFSNNNINVNININNNGDKSGSSYDRMVFIQGEESNILITKCFIRNYVQKMPQLQKGIQRRFLY